MVTIDVLLAYSGELCHFPQLAGLGSSAMADIYGISSPAEALAGIS